MDNKADSHQRQENATPGSTRKLLVVGAISLAIWFVLATLLAIIPAIKNSFDSGALSLRGFNSGVIENDTQQNLYFVSCSNVTCRNDFVTPHLADYNLITPGHSVNIPIAVGSNSIKTVGVYNSEQYLQGCVRFLPSSAETEVVTVRLSTALEPCSNLS